MARIDYHFSVLSPFAYLAGTRLEEIAARHGAEIAYRPLDIIALFAATGGTPPSERHRSRKEYRLQELRRGAEAAALPINLQPAHWPTDPVPASTAIIALAEAGGKAGALGHGVLSACWAEERDIADPAVVADLLKSVGADAEALAPRMAEARAIYDRNLADAIEAGVFGPPFYVVGEERFWGQDRLDALDRHLSRL